MGAGIPLARLCGYSAVTRLIYGGQCVLDSHAASRLEFAVLGLGVVFYGEWGAACDHSSWLRVYVMDVTIGITVSMGSVHGIHQGRFGCLLSYPSTLLEFDLRMAWETRRLRGVVPVDRTRGLGLR